jgi:hypothetical protein
MKFNMVYSTIQRIHRDRDGNDFNHELIIKILNKNKNKNNEDSNYNVILKNSLIIQKKIID